MVRPQEGLGLPGARPFPVVLAITLQAAHHRARSPFRTQVGIQDQRGIGTVPAEQIPQLGDDAQCLLPGTWSVTDDEETVGVRTVGQLLAAPSSHRDDANWRGVLNPARHCGQRSVDRRSRQVGEGPADAQRAGDIEDVRDEDPKQFTTPHRTDPPRRRGASWRRRSSGG